MSRIRTIKPEFFINEKISKLDPLTRIAFPGLWTQADREGKLEDRPMRLKAQILPYDDIDFKGILEELEGAGFITRYSLNGENYIKIIGFLQHQRPHNREVQSEIPEPTDFIPPNNPPKRKEGKGMENGGCTTKVVPEHNLGSAFEIITDLNKKANTAFKSSTRKTQELIQARFKEGFKFEDFEIVHTKKCKEWIGTDFAKFLRPITLYGTKFEGYLNQVDMEAEVKEKKRLAEDKHKAEKMKQDEIDDKIKFLRISTNKYLSKISPEDLKKLTREAETRMKTDGIDPESGLFRATINIYIRAIVAERLKLKGDLK